MEADGFLYNMVRAIAGTLMNVGRGYWPESQVAAILHAEDRTLAGPTAPAQGLFLMRVTYERRAVVPSEHCHAYPRQLTIVPLAEPPMASVRVPGSKSITNRALVLAALTASATSMCFLMGDCKAKTPK